MDCLKRKRVHDITLIVLLPGEIVLLTLSNKSQSNFRKFKRKLGIFLLCTPVQTN